MFEREQIEKQVLNQLGLESVPVEIGPDGIDACVDRTLEILGRYKPNTRHETFITPATGVTAHECPADVMGVSQIDIVASNAGSFASMNIENAMLSGQPVFYSTTDTYLDIQYFDERLRWIKTAQRVLASDPDYAYVRDPVTGIYTIYVFATNISWVDAVTVIPYNNDLKTIPYHLQNWFVEYLKAEVMDVVSHVRGKFVQIPVAGGKMELNGPALSAKAEKEKNRLLEFIQGSRADLFPRWA